MFIVTIKNDGISTEIHNNTRKLSSGKVVKGINAIDSFSFTVLPSNPCFASLHDFKTLVSVYNTNKDRYEFHGRVLCSDTDMSEDGMITKSVTCESFFGFLCDSQQPYKKEQNWTVRGLFEYLISVHNSQVEDYKRFTVGEVTVADDNDNVYCGIQRENTWDTIKKKLIDTLGGELRFRVVGDVIYIDYLEEIGEEKTTAIMLSRNMQAIRKEKDPSAYITRLIPLGCKLKEKKTSIDDGGNVTETEVETEERLDITEVNGGKNYIDDETAIETYGLHVGYVEFDDVKVATNLLRKGQEWLAENNKVQVKYTITALDLSLLDLDVDDFDVCNYHPIKNHLLGIDDTARIIKKNIDICDEVNSSIEVGDNFKTLSDIQLEQSAKVDTTIKSVEKIEADYVTNETLTNETRTLNSLIKQSVDSITLSVSNTYVRKAENEEYKQTVESRFEQMDNEFLMKFTNTSEQIVAVDKDLQTKFNEVYEYISFAGGKITLGTSESAVTLVIENDQIVFQKNGVPFGSWDGDNFYTGNIVVKVNERAQFGNFAFIPRSDGSLSFLKVGG